MKVMVFFLAMIPYLAIAQCDPAGMGLLSAEVHGDTVVLKNDTAYRNCGALYTMGVKNPGNDTLIWLQTDTGDVAYCYCNFDLSVTLDSISPGDYIVKAYYTDLVYNDTCYIGFVPFTISQTETYQASKIIHQWQSDCFTIGMKDNQDFSERWAAIYPNPVGNMLFVKTETDITGKIQVFSLSGQLVGETVMNGALIGISTTDYKPGLYLIKLIGSSFVAVKKFKKD